MAGRAEAAGTTAAGVRPRAVGETGPLGGPRLSNNSVWNTRSDVWEAWNCVWEA